MNTPIEIVPSDYVRVPTRNHLEVAAWLMPSGATYVQLIDETEATWEAYCACLRGIAEPLREVIGNGAIIP